MYTAPIFYPKVSERLSELLDVLGLDIETIKKKRNIYLKTEQIWSDMTTTYNVTVHHFGSQTEGTTTKGLDSDLDSLTCFNSANVIDSLSQWKKGKLNLLAEADGNIAPGYCRLLCLRNDITMYKTEKKIFDSNHLFEKERVYLKNSYILSITERICMCQNYKFIKKGPSGSGTDKIDFVTAFRYLGCSERETTRIKWPFPDIIDKAIRCDKYIVPVGHPESETGQAEWRISASMGERILMFSLNETQLKCYVMVKMLKVNLFRPYVGDSLTSYHCKNTLFHTIANTHKNIWRPHHLLTCIHLNLVTLLSFLRNGFCPQFFNQNVNLFTGKITRTDCKKLMQLIEGVLENNLTDILAVQIDDIGTILTGKMTCIHSTLTIRTNDQNEDGMKINNSSIDSKAWKNWLALHFAFVTEFSRHSGSYIAKYIVELSHNGFKVSSSEPEEHSELEVVQRFTKKAWKIPPTVKLKFMEIMQEMQNSIRYPEDRHLVLRRRKGRFLYSVKNVSDITEDEYMWD